MPLSFASHLLQSRSVESMPSSSAVGVEPIPSLGSDGEVEPHSALALGESSLPQCRSHLGAGGVKVRPLPSTLFHQGETAEEEDEDPVLLPGHGLVGELLGL